MGLIERVCKTLQIFFFIIIRYVSYIWECVNIIYSDIVICNFMIAVIGFDKGVSGLADNKRFVSYMYEYKEDVKLASIGYTRVDARGSQCKILIHISLPSMEGRLLKAYMFYRKPGTARFAYLGNVLIQDGTGELKVKSDRENVANSDLSLDDMCGVIVYQNSHLYSACEWDDEPVTKQLIQQIENPDLVYPNRPVQDSEKSLETERPITVVDYEGKPAADIILPTEMEVTGSKPAPEMEVTESKPAPEIEVTESKPVTEIEATVNKPVTEMDISVILPVVSDIFQTEQENLLEASELCTTQEAEPISYDNRDYYKEQSSRQNYYYRNMRYQNSDAMDSGEVKIQECPEVECVEPTYGECGEGIEEKPQAQARKEGTGRFECHPIAQNIIRKFPRIYPFEDNEICDCVRIEPQDIGLLPIDAWVLGNNSYLLHGYYTYRHLIFGKINSPNGIIYVLGVPGIYQNRESFMAKMFGFEYFKCAKRTEEKNGEFGYYYLPIQLG